METELEQVEEQNDSIFVESQFQQSSEKEITESRAINLNCHIDTEKLMIAEAKKLLNAQEECNLRKITMLNKNHEINKIIDSLKMRIKLEEGCLLENRLMTDNEEKKLVENLNLTQSTRDILDKLSNYIESFEKRTCTLQSSTLNTDFEKIFGSRIKNILDKKKIICDIKIPAEKYEKCLLELRRLQNEVMQNKDIENNLDNEKLRRDERKRKIEQDLVALNEKIQENENMKRDNFESELKVVETKNRQNIEVQKLIIHRDNLKERIASSQALFVDLQEELERTLLKKNNLDREMKIFQENLTASPEIDLQILENTSISEFEVRIANLFQSNEELIETLRLLREKESELVQLNCDEKINLLNSEMTISDLQKELEDSQKLYNEEKLHLSNREHEEIDMEKTVEESLSNMEKEKNTSDFKQQIIKEIETRLELLKSDTSKQKIEFEYQQKTVLPYLETKMEDLKKKLAETETRVNDEQRKLEEMQAMKIKKTKQLNKAKTYFLMYNEPKNENSTQSEKCETEENKTEDTETKEVIEEEQPSDERAKKSILKSPNSPAPQTPKKNVTFIGVPDSESCSSYDNKSNQDLDDILNLETPPFTRIRNRNFD